MRGKKTPLDEAALNTPSLRFASKLFARFPSIREYAWMQKIGDSDEFCLLVDAPDQSSCPDLKLGIWMEEGIEPSLGFGPSHTHAKVEMAEANIQDGDEAILTLLGKILSDEIVVSIDSGGEHDGHMRWLDISTPNAIIDYLTDKYSPDQITIRSWSGNINRVESITESDI